MKLSMETKIKWMADHDRMAIREMFAQCRKENKGKLWFDSGVDSEENYWSALRFWGALILASIIVLSFIATAHAEQNFTDEQIVNAIYHAEGGTKAKYLFGIRSVTCHDYQSCRNICKNTVKNNRKRYVLLEKGKFTDFVQFLGSRYCPTKGRTLSTAERKLNGNWERNVKYFLTKRLEGR